jgi:hypothetical protein
VVSLSPDGDGKRPFEVMRCTKGDGKRLEEVSLSSNGAGKWSSKGWLCAATVVVPVLPPVTGPSLPH